MLDPSEDRATRRKLVRALMKPNNHELPDIVYATSDFEKWASRHVKLIRSDVNLRHRNMACAAFPFLCAAFYRWTQWWPIICPELACAPQVLAVGDLHIENFGSWRDLAARKDRWLHKAAIAMLKATFNDWRV